MKIQPLEIPPHFNVDFYREQKELRKTDAEIATELFISVPLLAKWKRKIGCIAGEWAKNGGNRPKVDVDRIIELHKQGLRNYEIQRITSLSKETIKYHVDKFKKQIVLVS